MANLLNQNVVDYSRMTRNNLVSRTPPQVTPLVSKDRIFVSNQQIFVVITSDCKQDASSARYQKGSWEADEKEKVNHYWTRPFYDNSQPVHNIGCFAIVNSDQIKFLIAVVPA